jgi:prevent-host-death family protein
MYKTKTKAKRGARPERSKIKKTVASTAQVRADLADTVNRVAYAGERVILRRHGKPLAAVVSMGDLRLLEELENRLDLEAARRAFAETGSIPWEKFKAIRGF